MKIPVPGKHVTCNVRNIGGSGLQGKKMHMIPACWFKFYTFLLGGHVFLGGLEKFGPVFLQSSLNCR